MKEANIWKRVQKNPDGCWIWTGSIDRDGYGYLSHGGKSTTGAHRVLYEMHNGPIPEGLTIDHLCEIRPCVNPEHLEAVTFDENQRRRRKVFIGPTATKEQLRLARGICRNGHDMKIVGTLARKRPNGKVEKRCRACQHETQAKHRRAKGLPERGRRGAYGSRKEQVWEVSTGNISKVG